MPQIVAFLKSVFQYSSKGLKSLMNPVSEQKKVGLSLKKPKRRNLMKLKMRKPKPQSEIKKRRNKKVNDRNATQSP